MVGWKSLKNTKNWELMRSFKSFHGSIVFGGDFNEVLCWREIEGGVSCYSWL